MSYSKLAKLALKLNERTKDGSISWEETAIQGRYQAEINNNSVQIYRELIHETYDDEEPEYDYFVKIFNEMGSEVESFSDVDIRDVMPGDANSYRVLTDIYKSARRIALGTDQVLDSILNALGDDEII